MKKLSEWTKKQKIVLGSVLAVAVIGGGVGATSYSTAQAQKQEISQTKKSLSQATKQLEKLNKELDALRQTDNPSFLTKDVKQDEVTAIVTKLKKLAKKEINYDLNDTKQQAKEFKALLNQTTKLADATTFQLTIQDKVNGLYQGKDKVAINGNEVDKELGIKDNLKQEDIDAVAKEFNNTKQLEYIPVKDKSVEGQSWQEAIQDLLDGATNQIKSISETQKLVDALFKDDKPIDTTNDNALKDVEKAVSGIKNEATKKTLTDKFNQVKEAVNKKKEADKKKKEDESKKAATSNQVSNNNQASTNNQGSHAGSNSNNVSGGNSNGGSNYTPPATGGGNSNGGSSNGGGSSSGGNNYNPPATGGGSSNGGGSSSTGGGSSSAGGYANQDQLNQAAEDASNADWSDFFK
ncbi:hypothetical protein [Vagococcus teuberi]